MLGRSYGGYSIEMSLDKVEYSRSIYSLLDFLGDVGGLSSILLEIGLSLGFLFSPALDEFLASNIFKARSKEIKSHSKKGIPFCRRDKRKSALIQKANQAIEKELDVVSFIRK